MNLLIVKWSRNDSFFLFLKSWTRNRENKTISESMKSGTLCNYKNRNYLIKDILLQKPAAQGQNLTKQNNSRALFSNKQN